MQTALLTSEIAASVKGNVYKLQQQILFETSSTGILLMQLFILKMLELHLELLSQLIRVCFGKLNGLVQLTH